MFVKPGPCTRFEFRMYSRNGYSCYAVVIPVEGASELCQVQGCWRRPSWNPRESYFSGAFFVQGEEGLFLLSGIRNGYQRWYETAESRITQLRPDGWLGVSWGEESVILLPSNIHWCSE